MIESADDPHKKAEIAGSIGEHLGRRLGVEDPLGPTLQVLFAGLVDLFQSEVVQFTKFADKLTPQQETLAFLATLLATLYEADGFPLPSKLICDAHGHFL